jgi:hypothetical protein
MWSKFFVVIVAVAVIVAINTGQPNTVETCALLVGALRILALLPNL